MVHTGAGSAPAFPRLLLNYFGVDASQPFVSVAQEGFKINPNPMPRRDGSNGIAATTSAGECQKRMRRQIRRWNAMRRHVAQIKRHCEHGDQTCRRAPEAGPPTLGHYRQPKDLKDYRDA